MFWRHAFAIKGSITPHVMPNVAFMGLFATAVCLGSWFIWKYFGLKIGLTVAPYELIGAALGLLLVLRTNGGYERWWEARKLWGGIVNQCRNLAIDAAVYGPKDSRWQADFRNLIAAFPYIAGANLRNQKPPKQVSHLLGDSVAEQLGNTVHMPSSIVAAMAKMLQEARDEFSMDGFSFIQIDRERATLIEHIGACERIKNTPLPLAYSIKIRRFIATFLLTLPFALIHDVGNNWLVPLITMLVAYPLFALDQLGVELQNPFDSKNLSHLPLDDISDTVEKNVLTLSALPLAVAEVAQSS
ncbi:MAG: hypothetical protein JST89_13595 [Cyanobacteria bacterium SZAS-4]|nr:hypothetical protein [Cyanobacteria bacterium SZAS-4]